jgi:transposase
MVQYYRLWEVIALFIKTTKANGYEYIKLVESYWEDGKSKHRVLYNFGRADLIKMEQGFLNVVKRLCEIAELPFTSEDTEEKQLLEGCSEATIYNYGYLAYLKLWRKLGIEETIEDQARGYKLEYPLAETVFLMAVQHLLEPRSKLSTYTHQKRYFNMREIPLHHMYRALDVLSKQKENIEGELFEYNYVRVNKKVDVVFYDVTTFAFESTIADELKDFGYSKTCKFNEVQVVMGMIIDSNGLPVGYELFPGNTFDGKTMLKALGNIQKRFGIDKVIIVADRGLNSKGNLNLIKNAKYGYIMSSKIKSMGKSMQAKVLDAAAFTIVNDSSGNEEFRYKTMEYSNDFKDDNGVLHCLPENLIVTYSQKRAKKDRKDRERLVEKANKLLEDPEKIKASNKRGGKKYIDQTDPEKPLTWKLAVEKIEQDAKFDGYYGIQTSEKDMTVTEVIEAYHTLWKIEESFRVMKSTMEVRPIFHWKPKRIEGHFMVCFLAFLMERTMELMLKDVNDEVASSPQRIQGALNTMQLAAVTTAKEELFIKAKSDPLCNKIFKLLKIDLPANISAKQALIERLKLDEERIPMQMVFFDLES